MTVLTVGPREVRNCSARFSSRISAVMSYLFRVRRSWRICPPMNPVAPTDCQQGELMLLASDENFDRGRHLDLSDCSSDGS
jgi:hypothetical protein